VRPALQRRYAAVDLFGAQPAVVNQEDGHIMGQDKENGLHSARAFGGVLAILAVVGGIAAIVRPLQEQMNNMHEEIDRRLTFVEAHAREEGHPRSVRLLVEALERRIDELASRLEKHADSDGHPVTQRELAAIRESFREVESRIHGLQGVMDVQQSHTDRRFATVESWQKEHDLVEQRASDGQWARLVELERRVYGYGSSRPVDTVAPPVSREATHDGLSDHPGGRP